MGKNLTRKEAWYSFNSAHKGKKKGGFDNKAYAVLP